MFTWLLLTIIVFSPAGAKKEPLFDAKEAAECFQKSFGVRNKAKIPYSAEIAFFYIMRSNPLYGAVMPNESIIIDYCDTFHRYEDCMLKVDPDAGSIPDARRTAITTLKHQISSQERTGSKAPQPDTTLQLFSMIHNLDSECDAEGLQILKKHFACLFNYNKKGYAGVCDRMARQYGVDPGTKLRCEYEKIIWICERNEVEAQCGYDAATFVQHGYNAKTDSGWLERFLGCPKGAFESFTFRS